MILAEEFDVTDDPFALIVQHFPTSEALDGKTLDVTWEEEAAFNEGLGMAWPAYFAAVIADRYRALGETMIGLTAELNVESDKFCRVTFKVERNSRPH